jgi:hypothetical protein
MTAASASSIASLTALLPPAKPVTEDGDGPWDLDLLTASQLNALERLYDIAHGRKPAVPPHRQKSDTYWACVDLANTVDQIAAHGGADTVTESERIAMCNAFTAITGKLGVTHLGLFDVLYGGLPIARSALPAPPEEPEAPPPANVVPLHDPRGNGSCAIDTPLEQRYPHLQDTPPVGRW